jgi:hypothetical protein
LQLAANELAPALRVIFQKSITTGELPLSWLQANITPIFKKGDRTVPSNYRPISLTSICCKLLEHIIYSNIIDHLDHHQSLNNKSQVDMIIMDFSKAFDTVPNNRLLNKLKRHGINNKTHAWITKFLTCREERVVVSGEHSPWTHVKSGVPQGTVLGPLLFLIYMYINDLPNNIHSTVCLFADDCVLYREITRTTEKPR